MQSSLFQFFNWLCFVHKLRWFYIVFLICLRVFPNIFVALRVWISSCFSRFYENLSANLGKLSLVLMLNLTPNCSRDTPRIIFFFSNIIFFLEEKRYFIFMAYKVMERFHENCQGWKHMLQDKNKISYPGGVK